MEALGIDLKLIIAQLVNFGILLFLLNKFLYKPVINMLDERKNKVEVGIKDAESAKINLENAEGEATKIIAQAKVDASEILKNAHTQALNETSATIKKANDQVDRLIENAKDEAGNMKKKALIEAKSEISGLIGLALDKVISEELSKDQKEKLTAKALSEL
ncbi:MAG: F0F1 ATP synthase subunit B [bacterium]